jgi:plastocyanin
MMYSNGCFNFGDSNLTIARGDTVKFQNFSETRAFWPASNNHPTHTLYPEFDAGQPYYPNSSWSFTFLKAGAWGYHDHMHPECTGTITVQ